MGNGLLDMWQCVVNCLKSLVLDFLEVFYQVFKQHEKITVKYKYLSRKTYFPKRRNFNLHYSKLYSEKLKKLTSQERLVALFRSGG